MGLNFGLLLNIICCTIWNNLTRDVCVPFWGLIWSRSLFSVKDILRNLCFSQKNERHAGLDQPEGEVNDDRTFIRGWTIPLKVWTTAFPKLQGWASCQSKWRQSGSSRTDRGTAPVRAPRPPLTGRTRKCHHDQPYMGWILNHNCKMKTWTYGTSFWAQHHRLPSRSERSALHNTTLRRGQAAYSCQAARRRLEGGTHLFFCW